jgi:hypothetical protein
VGAVGCSVLCLGELLVADEGWSKAFVCEELYGNEERGEDIDVCSLIIALLVDCKWLFCGRDVWCDCARSGEDGCLWGESELMW